MHQFGCKIRRSFCKVMLLCFVLMGCSKTTNPSTVPGADPLASLPTGEGIPLAQRSALSDRVVTKTEYDLAWLDLQSCLQNNGGKIWAQEISPVSGLRSLASTNDLSDPATPEGRCYEATFKYVEIEFQFTDPTTMAEAGDKQRQLYVDMIRPCLKKNGVSTPEGVDPGSAKSNEFSKRWAELSQQGKC